MNTSNLPPTSSRFLIESDAAYFALAAKRIDLGPGQLLVNPEFTDIPAACVVSSITGRANQALTHDWIELAEQTIQNYGFRLSRLYFTDGHDSSQRLLESGYRSRLEIGYFTATSGPTSDDRLTIHDLEPGSSWDEKLRIHIASSQQSDGYVVPPDRWLEFEKAKCQSGAMTAHLARMGDRGVATFCTLEHDGYLRLKNLLVDRAARRRGVATSIIRMAAELASSRQLRGVIAFAVSGSSGEGLYRRTGMRQVGRVREWQKDLSG